MYVCHCRAVTETTIRAAIEAGARSWADLARRCGAGSRCGGCSPLLRQLLADYGVAEFAGTGQDGHAA